MGIVFKIDPLSPGVLRCVAEPNALVIKAGSDSGAVRLTHFAFQGGPASFAPERRPFSRGPVVSSPDPHPAIAAALVEWDWRMQDGIQTPREARTYRQAIEKILAAAGWPEGCWSSIGWVLSICMVYLLGPLHTSCVEHHYFSNYT